MKLQRYRKLIVFLLDLTMITCVSSLLFTVLPESKGNTSAGLQVFLPNLILCLLCSVLAQCFFKTYDSLWRYAQSMEYLMLLYGGISGVVIYIALNFALLDNRISTLFCLASYSVSLQGMLIMRLCYRRYRMYRSERRNHSGIPIAIYGAGEAGAKLLEEIDAHPSGLYQVTYFIDDSREKIGKRIHNIEVRGPVEKLEQILTDYPIEEIVISSPTISAEKRKGILDLCCNRKCRVRTLPSALFLLEKDEYITWEQVRDINLEELLGRVPVNLENDEITDFLKDKTILVTGGGGSIGSELCRQVAKADIKKLVIIDIYENNAYDIQQELLHKYGSRFELKVEIASIRDQKKINLLMEQHRPNIIFHAAAHKHVPLMEDCPEEAILNNIFGTYHLVDAADRYGVDKFVLISTDKAVNPTSIMGATKRFCEMLLQSRKESSRTEFVAVRFGNVLGSNGSVIPLFQKQIAQGGPVKITDKRIVRYFMTIPEAVLLVLQAGTMANRSEIYVLDMGEPVNILDLAENLIRLSGYIPYSEIPIIETGLRPGEKLYEELLVNPKELTATKNQKIFVDHQENISNKIIQKDLKRLKKALKSHSKTEIKDALRKAVPSYKDPEEVNINHKMN